VRDLQAQKFSEERADLISVRLVLVFIGILERKGYLGTEEQDEPAELQPYQKKGKCSETAVNGIVLCYSNLENNIEFLYNNKDCSCSNACNKA